MEKINNVVFTLLHSIVLVSMLFTPSVRCLTATSIEVTEIETGRTIGKTWMQSVNFLHNEFMSVNVTSKNNGEIEETATVFASAYDEINMLLGSDEANITLAVGECGSVLLSIYIPRWAYSGDACHVVALARPISNPISSNEMDCIFSILAHTATYLNIDCLFSATSLDCMRIWIDSSLCLSPLMIPLTPGTHTVQAASTQPFENGASFRLYVFKRWENNSTLTLRTIDIVEEANQTLTAYYNRLAIISFSRLKLGTHFVAGRTF